MFRRACYLAYRQLTQRAAKLVAALVGVCVAIILMFMQVGFENALYDSALNMPSSLDGDIIITSRDFSTMSFAPPWLARGLLFEARGVEGIESALPLYAFNMHVQDTLGGRRRPVWLFGVPLSGSVLRNAEVSSQLDLIAQPDVVILDSGSRRDFQAIVKRVAADGHDDLIVPRAGSTLQYIASVRGLFTMGPTFSIDGTLITSDINFTRMTAQPLDRVSIGVVRMQRGFDLEQVKARLQQQLDGRAKVFTKAEFINNERKYYAQQTPIGYIFRIGLLVGIAVGVVFISQALHGIISDNMTEYAVLRAMGYRQSFFLMLIGSITAGFVVLAYVPSLLATALLYRIAASATQLPMTLKGGDMLLILLIVLMMGTVAAVMAIRKLRNASPVDLFS